MSSLFRHMQKATIRFLSRAEICLFWTARRGY